MKKGIHPEYTETLVTCACGHTFTTRSTVESIHVEICSRCHPFFTGRQKLVDTAGRVERFRRKYGDGEGGKRKKAKRQPATKAKTAKKTEGKAEGKAPENKAAEAKPAEEPQAAATSDKKEE